jgi:stage III sporulation protein AE
MAEIDFSEIQTLIDELCGTGINFQEMVERGTSGEAVLSWKKISQLLQQIFLKELLTQKQLWIHILLLALIAAVLVHFADVFENQSVSQISFCIVYMLLFMLLIVSFKDSMEIAEEVLQNMGNFMKVLAPAYFLAMTLASYLTTAGIYYEFVLLLIAAIRVALKSVLLPCIQIYVTLVLVDHLTKDHRLSGLTELLGMLVGWSLKAALAVVMGFHMIQGLISPAADSVRTTVVSRGLQSLPGIKEVSGTVTDLMLGSALLIKNSIGAAALIILLLLCMAPLVKLAVMMVAYYLLAALLQPVSDRRITGCLVGIGNGVKLLLQTVFTVLLLFLLTVALTTAVTGK